MITRRFDFDAFQKFKRKLDRKTATEIFVVEEDGQLVDLRRFAGRRFDYDGAPYAIAEYSDGSAAVLDLEDRPLFDPNGKPFDSDREDADALHRSLPIARNSQQDRRRRRFVLRLAGRIPRNARIARRPPASASEVRVIPPAPLRLVPPSAIPAELRETNRWLAWKLLHGKKPPVDAAGHAMSAWQESSTWLSFADAKKRAAGLDGQAGVGFVLGDGFAGIDLDDCRDPGNGDVGPQAKAVIAFAEGAYAEVSPSGEGLKVFGRGEGWIELNFGGKDSVAVDRKASGYFCVTGKEYQKGDLVDLPLNAVFAHFTVEGVKAKVGAQPLPKTIRPGAQNTELFKEACRHARDGKTEDEIFAIVQAVAKNRAPNTPGMRPWEDQDFRGIARSAARYPPAPDPYPPTESGDAEFFAARFAADLRFDHLRNEWLRFDGLRWAAQISGEVKVLAKDAIRARLAAATLDLDAPGGRKAREVGARGRVGREARTPTRPREERGSARDDLDQLRQRHALPRRT